MQLQTKTADCGYTRRRTQWEEPDDKHIKE